MKDFLLQKGKLKYFDIISKTYINIFDSEKEEISPDEIKNQYKNMNGKVLINLAFIGNLKSGKSTTIGHLLYSTGKIDKYSQLYKDAINSAQNNEYKYSFLINTYKDERVEKKTIMYHLNKFELINMILI